MAHAASHALAGREDALRVLVTASPTTRLGRLAEAEGLDETLAAKAIKDADAGRADYLKRFHAVEQELPTQYDLEALVAWCVFCTVTSRTMRINQNTGEYFEIADRDDLGYEEKLARYRELADAYLQSEEFEEFRAAVLPDLHELTVEYVESPEFDQLIVHCVRLEVEPERQEEMIERSRSSVGAWAADQRAGARG